jgi:hypothetical protein
MDRTLKALSLILSYPTAELQEAMPEIGAILAADPRLTPATRAALQRLTSNLGQGDLFDVQESYVIEPLRTCPRRKPGPGRCDGQPDRNLPGGGF